MYHIHIRRHLMYWRTSSPHIRPPICSTMKRVQSTWEILPDAPMVSRRCAGIASWPLRRAGLRGTRPRIVPSGTVVTRTRTETGPTTGRVPSG